MAGDNGRDVPGHARRSDARGQPGANRKRDRGGNLAGVGHVRERVERSVVVEGVATAEDGARHPAADAGDQSARGTRKCAAQAASRRKTPRRPDPGRHQPAPWAGQAGDALHRRQHATKDGCRRAGDPPHDPPHTAGDAPDATPEPAKAAADAARRMPPASSASIASITNGLSRWAIATAAGPVMRRGDCRQVQTARGVHGKITELIETIAFILGVQLVLEFVGQVTGLLEFVDGVDVIERIVILEGVDIGEFVSRVGILFERIRGKVIDLGERILETVHVIAAIDLFEVVTFKKSSSPRASCIMVLLPREPL